MLESKLIDFEGGQILGVKDENGVLWLGVNQTCKNLGLTEGQMKNERKKIQEDLALQKGGRNLILLSNGGNQDTLCIREDYVTLWLAKISITPKMKLENPETVEKLIKYQLECARVLHNHFMGTEDKKQQFFDEMGIKGEFLEMKNLIKQQGEKLDHQNNKIINLTDKLEQFSNTFIFKQYENPTHKFEALLTQYGIHCNLGGGNRYYNFYRDFSNWLGFELPNKQNYTIKEYIIQNIKIETMECFVNGIVKGRIVKSKQGNFLDLNGVFCNPVEWEKIKIHFNNSCAYCGADDKALIAEHIKPKRDEQSNDLIHNIIPACQDCNKSKDELHIKEWYPKQSFFDVERYKAIKEHWLKYRIDNN